MILSFIKKHFPIILVAAITAALFIYPYLGIGEKSAGKREDKKNPVLVTVDTVSRGSIIDQYQTVATLQGREEVPVLSQVEGVLERMNVAVGDQVRKGQSLAQLDQRLQAAALRQAQARLAHANEEYERAQALAQRRLVNQTRLQTAIENKASAQAEVERLSTLLSFTSFRSPIRGTVIQQRVFSGNNVQAGDHLFTISDVSSLLVFTQVPEALAAQLSKGDPAKITYDPTGLSIPANILRVYPASDAISHQVGVEIEAGEVFPRLKPGYQVTVSLAVASREGVLVVDRAAIPDDPGLQEATVFTIRQNQAQKRKVRLGLVTDAQVEVLEGLQEGDLVVRAGAERLKEGSPVKVVPHVNQ